MCIVCGKEYIYIYIYIYTFPYKKFLKSPPVAVIFVQGKWEVGGESCHFPFSALWMVWILWT